MGPRINAPIVRLGTTVCTLTAMAACDHAAPLIPASADPLVIAVLELNAPVMNDPQVAIVLSAGTPLQPQYRAVDRFEMRRERDGAPFGWQSIARSGPPPSSFQGLTLTGAENVVLPSAAVAGRLGGADLAPMERYTLELETDAIVVRGSVVIPAPPAPRFDTIDGRRRIVWPKSAAAAGYLIRVDTDIVPAVPRPITDTTYVMREDREPTTRPPTPKATIIALDSNLFRFLSDTTVRSSGLSGALGVFGGLARTVVVVP